MKKLSLYLLLLTGLSVSTVGYTSIAPHYVSGNPANPTLSVTGGDSADGSYYVGNNVYGSFNDEWDFTLAGNAALDDTASAYNNVKAHIQDNSLTVLLQKQTGANWNNVLGSVFSASSASYDFLTLGSYRFLVSGTGNGTAGKGSYGFNVNVYSPISASSVPTAVPTPQSWALLLAGTVFLVGFQKRRKSETPDSMLMIA